LSPIINQEIAYLQSAGPDLLQTALTTLANTPLAKWIPSGDTVAQNLSRLDSIITGAIGTLPWLSCKKPRPLPPTIV